VESSGRPPDEAETNLKRAAHIDPSICGNCAAALTGPYCSQCGQPARESARSLGAVLRDGWHLFVHVDGRVWYTLWTLLAKPGQLTLDYFADRRARYVSPVRLYFVISIAFFALTAANSSLMSKAAASAPAAVAATDSAVNASSDVSECDNIELRPPWLQARLRAACRRQIADNGKSAARAFGSYIPKMMFLFLPLVALTMVPLYRSPRHYYVEHVVFFLHIQSALFLVMIADMLLSLASHWSPRLSGLASIGDLAAAAAAGYAIWCSYRAMRRYYGEGRAPTLVKLAIVGIAYQVFLVVMVAATLLLSALTA
jgi:Protein of unknown function (DUF3667)